MLRLKAKKDKALGAVAAATPATPKNLKTMTTSSTGGVLADSLVPSAQNYKIVTGPDGSTCSCYLMWSDLTDNHNKFYVSLALQHTMGSFSLWTRFGHVGSDGVGPAQPCGSLAELNKLYEKKYREKVRKGYTEVKMVTAEPAEEVKGEDSKGERESLS